MLIQFFESTSSTYTYLLVCDKTKESIIIDPVKCDVDKYIEALAISSSNLVYILETHVHADHITAAADLKKITHAKSVIGKLSDVHCADLMVSDGCIIRFGDQLIEALSTPGHTHACTSYYTKGMVFTGDTLLIDGCGRTDFQSGNSEQLYQSVHNKLFTLPDHTIVYPAHDYHGRKQSTILHEKQFNARLNQDITQLEFIQIMDRLNLPYPSQIDKALPANQMCGQSTFEPSINT